MKGKIILGVALAVVLAANGTGVAMADDEEKLQQLLIEDTQKRIARSFQPPHIREQNRQLYNPDNQAIVHFQLTKTSPDCRAKKVALVSSKGDPAFAKAAEETIRNRGFRPNLLKKEPLCLKCIFTETEIVVQTTEKQE